MQATAPRTCRLPPARAATGRARPILACLLVLLAGCSSELEEVRERGELRVVTRNGPTTYYEDRTGPTGFEFALAQRFAEYLGVTLAIEVVPGIEQVYRSLTLRQADVAAAGLNVTADRRREARFGPPYLGVTPDVVYRMGTPRPKRLDDLEQGKLAVARGSSHAERLRELARSQPGLTWEEIDDVGVIDLMRMVQDKEIDYTVVSSNDLAVNQSIFPHVRAAFSLAPAIDIAWAIRRGRDQTLLREIHDFFTRLRESGELDKLIELHFSHTDQLNYVGARTFIRHIKRRLPRYREWFVRAAEQFGFDWRLLAAVGYQESHWNPKAVSPTGVRGLMMLTRVTAQEMGVKNRLDPRESIFGGADYLSRLRERLPAEIGEPDRTWMALAAYNVGYGHLQDAWAITRRQGGNPWLWEEVRQRLPLLSKKKWYSQTRYGYARGYEPVHYVGNIRRYYDVLVWIEPRAGDAPRENRPAPIEPLPGTVDIAPPVL